ncbi:MAG: ATP-binding protein [Ruminococcaceae bacterium]|nr:ATP-binding protein [Oscillospiraceae bacterium]
MIPRDNYLELLKSFKNKELIKVVTGIRRCGKSTLYEIYRNYLMESGISEQQIISINLEDPDFAELRESQKLYAYINERLIPDKINYVFLDEVQKVKDFQEACDGLYIKKNVDLYITGSNAGILSGELATLLSGRYVEIKMLPLSFKEYVSTIGDKTDLSRKYREYIENGSFPYITELEGKKAKSIYLESIYNSVVLKDIISRKKILDVSTLENVIRFIFDNIGNPTSATKIANALTSSGNKTTVNTVESYLRALQESFIIYKAERYDIKGKQLLETGGKYYVADIGLRYYLLGTKKADRGHILENIIYLELLRRGYEVYVGKAGTTEVDFIAINNEGTEYYQVAYTVADDSVLERELKPINNITDHNPKYLLTMDDEPIVSHNGIKQINALDWLLA